MLLRKQPGVYLIQNILNGHRYIGSSSTLGIRWSQHQSDLKHDRHPNQHLQHAWKLYGAQAFEFICLCLCDRDTLALFEQRFIDVLHPEYNIAPQARSMIGVPPMHHTVKSKQRISAARKGKPLTQEHRQKLRIAKLGTHPKRDYSNMPDEVRQKISATLKARGIIPPSRKGVSPTEEQIRKQKETFQQTMAARKILQEVSHD